MNTLAADSCIDLIIKPRECDLGEFTVRRVMLVARQGQALELRAEQESRVMIIGGKPLGERHVWWNFVSSSRERMEQAKDDWREGRFGLVPRGRRIHSVTGTPVQSIQPHTRLASANRIRRAE